MKNFIVILGGLILLTQTANVLNAHALELDWSGQFRSEFNFIRNYSMDSSDAGSSSDSTRANAGGYYVSGAGTSSGNFQNLFLKLKPKLIVNDNVYIKSEWWLGDPVFGFYGNASPYTFDQKQFYSNQSRGSLISAQRFWAEILSDVGTFQIGRAPLNWGLGIVWNNGDGLWDRYESTGDMLRLVSKFGAFSFSPAYINYSTGNSIGGSCSPGGAPLGSVCTPGAGSGSMSDYSIMLKYDNPDEDFEGGVNFVKRLAGASQDPIYGYRGITGGSAGMNYNIWDIYGKKKLGKFTISAEAPITTGNVGGLDYSTFAIATEVDWRMSETWEILAKVGHAPGESNSAGATPDKLQAFFFNPNYKLGMIMFNYQLASFSALSTQNNPGVSPAALQSPYDNPIVDATYVALTGKVHADKWTFHGDWVYAKAQKVATQGSYFLNNWTRSMVQANADQSNSLGWELDAGSSLQWDDNFFFSADLGFFFPGDFYKFSNTAVQNQTSTVYGLLVRAGVNF